MENFTPVSVPLPERPGLLIIVSGPSGVGKDAALKRMKEMGYPFHFLVTNTTRPKRPDEVDGMDYHFITQEKFEAMATNGEFLEHAFVYGFNYGNAKAEVRNALARGQDVIMRIDVQGAATIKRTVPDAIFVFLLPPSMQVLERRLRQRHTEPEEILRVRQHAAQLEMNEIEIFDYAIVNEDDALDETARVLQAIITAEKSRVKPRHVTV